MSRDYEPNHSAERRAPASDVANHRRPSATKRAKPFKIETRWTLFDESAPWTTHKRYATEDARDQALRKLQRDRIKTHNGRSWGSSIEYR